MLAVSVALGRRVYSPKMLGALNVDDLSDPLLERVLAAIRSALYRRADETGQSMDTLAKNAEFNEHLLGAVLPDLINGNDSTFAIAWGGLADEYRLVLSRVAYSGECVDDADGVDARWVPLLTATRGMAGSEQSAKQVMERAVATLPGAGQGWASGQDATGASIVYAKILESTAAMIRGVAAKPTS